MNENWLDKELKDKFADYGSPMDLEGAWDVLETKRNQDKKKRFLLLFWLIGTLLLGFITYNLWIIKDPASTELISGISEHKKLAQGQNNASFSKDAKLNIEQTNNQNNENSNIVNNENTKDNQVKLNPSNSDISSTGTSKKWTSLTTSISVANQIEPVTTNSSSLGKKRNSLAAQKQYDSESVSSILIQDNSSDINSNFQLILQELIETKKVSSLVSSSDNPSLELKVEALKITDANTYNDGKIKSDQLPSYLSFAVGYGIINKGKLLVEETALDAISSNLTYQKFISKKVYLKTGINLDQFTTNISSSIAVNYIETLSDQLITVNHYQDGRQEQVKGLSDLEVIGTASYNIYNRYQFVSVPLIMGLSISPTSKSQIEFEGGFSSTIFSRYDVKNFVGGSVLEIKPVESMVLKKSGVINGLYGVQWNYQPFKHNNTALFLKYQGQMQLNNMERFSGLNINIEKFRVHQFMIGVRGKF